jgi:hypothetical protein
MNNPARAKTSKRASRAKTKKKPRILINRHLMEFPQVKGKKLEGAAFSTCIEDHSITLRFHDKTELRFDIEPGFTVFADYADWKTGNHQPIKKWPPVRSVLFRD